MSTQYFAVIGNRDHIKIDGDRRPFWEFLDCQPDGFLSSLAYLPLRDFDLPVGVKIADCGAWSYKDLETPKLGKNEVTPEFALNEYLKHFHPGDIVVAPDHMLIPDVDHDARRKFNISSAKTFRPLAEAEGFRPMATVHGMDLEERLRHIETLAALGYTHFAFGGLAARAAQKTLLLGMIVEMTTRVRELVPDAWIHVLGLSSPEYFANFKVIGVSSCDGSSHFKQAFTGGAFFTHNAGKLTKHKAARPGEEVTAPTCECIACEKLRKQGVDTRSYGSNEHNMGRAAHNLNMLMKAHSEYIYDAPRTDRLF